MANYKELLAQRELLDKQIEELRQVELRSAIEQARQLIADWELTAEDCGFKSVAVSASKKAKAAVAAKYRAPNGKTWSGRGRAPTWLTVLEAEGRQRSEFLIS
ncbi:MAG: H-NS histone family protein [Propionivibrio sp.]|nr:H-NS histone family protein [Propionivibrio sp.]